MNPVKQALLAIAFSAAATNAVADVSVAAGLPAQNYSQSTVWNAHPEYNAYSAFNHVAGWSSGTFGTQWIQVDLASQFAITGAVFYTGQQPDGVTSQSIFVSDSPIGNLWVNMTPVASQSGFTTSQQRLELDFAATAGRYVQIVANGGPSWTALNRVDVLAAVPEPATVFLMMAGGLFLLLKRQKSAY